MNYFESNMAAMKKIRNGIYKKIESYKEENSLDDSILVESAHALDGSNYLLVQRNNALHRLNSFYSPKHEAEKWVEQYSFHNLNVVISVFGLGSGVFTRELVKNKDTKDTIIIYEPSFEVFYHVLHHYDITDIINERSIILTIEGINEFDFHQALRSIVNITNIYSQIKCTHPGYEELFPETAIYFWKEIKDVYVHEKTNINTERFFGKRFITNGMFNTRYLKKSIRLLDIKKHLNTNIPAIVVAAGPSLKENIDELRKAKGKAYVFVVDRILDYVLDSGIEPDFIVTVDPIKPIEYFTTRTDVAIPLLCELDSNWEVLNQHKGRKIIYSCNPYFQKMYWSLKKEPPFINTGASVATSAFSACVSLGFKRIALVGQDLAYDGELTHAGGTTAIVSIEQNLNQDIYVDGINGEKVRSRPDWYQFLTWFKDNIRLHPEIEVIDTKSKGAKIDGAILMPLSDLLDKYGINNAIDNCDLQSVKDTFSDKDMEDILKFFEDTDNELYDLIRKSKDAILICEEQIRIYRNNNNDNSTTDKNYKKLSKINEFIGKQSAYFLIDTFITAETTQQISEMYKFTDNKHMDKISTYEKSISIYKAIIEGANYAKPLLLEALENL